VGIYGTVLGAFADQLHSMITFHMEPNVTSGYGARTAIRRFRGVIHFYSAPPTAEGVKAKVPSFQGAGKGNAIIQKWPFLWTKAALPIGDFVEYQSEVYRVVTENVWEFESDWSQQGLEKVVGLNGGNTNNLAFNTGANSIG
jgi:hypothetical protein